MVNWDGLTLRARPKKEVKKCSKSNNKKYIIIQNKNTFSWQKLFIKLGGGQLLVNSETKHTGCATITLHYSVV